MTEIVTDSRRLDDLQNDWERLLDDSVEPNVFLSWAWLRTWWRHFGEDRDDAQLHVVVVHGDDGLVAAAPWFVRTVGTGPVRARVLQQISYDAGDYGGILVRQGHDEAVRSLCQHLDRALHNDVSLALLSRLPSDGQLLVQLRDQLASLDGLQVTEADLGDACPYADLRQDYPLRKHLKKHKVRQRMRRLSEKHEVAHRNYSGDDLDEGLEALIGLHRRRWEGREDEMQGVLAAPEHEAFLLDALKAVDEAGHLRLRTLTADDQALAVELDLELAGRIYMYKGAFDPDFAEFSPGQLLHYHVFEDAIERGVSEIDFLRGDHPYKRRWATSDRRLITLTISNHGLRGRLSRQWVRLARALESRFG